MPEEEEEEIFIKEDPQKVYCIVFPTKGKYEGNLLNGKKHGRGKLTTEDIVYDCNWVEDRMIGKGSYHQSKNGERYEGELKDYEANGQGTMTRADGDVYTGHWVNTVLHGKGTLKTGDGDLYEGNWVEGTLTGKGKYRLANGEVYEGEFSEGEKNGKGKLTRPDGWIIEGKWVNDEYVDKRK